MSAEGGGKIYNDLYIRRNFTIKKNLRKVFAVSMAGAMVAGCIPAMADEAASTTNWEPFAETVTLRVPVYDRGAEGVPDLSLIHI